MTYTEKTSVIEGINKPAIIDYFATINQAEFVKTASLFADQGTLLAPFEEPIVGRAAIAAYLSKEAKGMKLLPQRRICETESETELETEPNCERYKILGKVKTALFSVNVAWYFTLSQDAQIATVRIKLLASPQELLGLQAKQAKQ
jgi:hypothetical protein